VLSPSLTTLRLFLHVLAASVWVGGQIALALGGAIGLLAGLGAMYCGYLLTTGT